MTAQERLASDVCHPPSISLTGVVKRFSGKAVLEGIDLDIANGEVVALLGRSGCGKSTLLNIVSGLLSSDGGHIEIEGVAAGKFRDWRRIVYMFQEDRLLPWRSVVDNVAFGLEAVSLKAASRRKRALEALALVGLEEQAHAWPDQLSGGMRSRVALARSLVVEPSILLMDEPFSKLDPQTRAQMHQEVLRLQRVKGVTVLLVTHDVEEAVVLADRVVILTSSPARIRAIEDIDIPHPRLPTDPEVAERIRQLRLQV